MNYVDQLTTFNEISFEQTNNPDNIYSQFGWNVAGICSNQRFFLFIFMQNKCFLLLLIVLLYSEDILMKPLVFQCIVSQKMCKQCIDSQPRAANFDTYNVYML